MPHRPKHAIADASLSLKIPAQPMASGSRAHREDLVCEGWLLKKRRRKLQGYARRYFVLDSTGLLSYSFEPGSDARDKILLPTAAISSNSTRRDIHVDSGTVTFHIKCLTTLDFDRWMSAFRKFTVANSDTDRATLRRSASKSLNQGTYGSRIKHAASLLGEMSRTIDDLMTAFDSFDEDDRKSAKSTDKDKSLNGKHRDKESHSLLSIFKKPSSSSSTSPHRPNFNKDLLQKVPSPSHPSEHLRSHLSRLRELHGTLSELILYMPSGSIHHRSPLQRTTEEDTANIPTLRSPLQQSTDAAQRASMSTMTDSSSIWFDAEDYGAEEYVVKDDQGDEDASITRGSPETEVNSSLSRDDGDDGSEAEDEDPPVPSGATAPEGNVDGPANRRIRLPARPHGDEGSLFSVLKKNVGQDLSNIAFPVTFNEPLTLLQRSAEEMEYHDLLDKAASATDWVERICYIAAFAVSGYACTKFRSGLKGFTPLLCETFEDERISFIAEKVEHKPLVIAYHADGPGWELSATSSGKTKFWGKSFEIIPTGMSRMRIGGDNFEWNKPSSFTRNLMMGTKYLEHCGEMSIKNTNTGAQCILDFKETGYWASTPNVISGVVHSPDGSVVTRLEGKWDEQFSQKLDANHFRVLWRIVPFPRDASEYYGYSYFGITLNEVTPDIASRLPCTDSRFRPDVRALEEGDVALAEEEKARVEQMQRERRQNGQEPTPRWFRQVDGNWVYTGGYWEARRSGWVDLDIKPLW
ncbi:hypothetical protein M0805_003413 [Coniferiporia weirii]|nr:hypothetical protein M0805_003413 [Coniferiporia weirii]